MVAVVTGGSGLTGSFLIKKLMADPQITSVISVTRKTQGLTNPKLIEVLLPDLAALPSKAAELRGDIYFCCLGTTIKTAGSQENFRKVDHDAVVKFAQIAKDHDAASFSVISAMGASEKSAIFYNKVKGQMEKDLKAKGFRSLNIFHPAFLEGPRKEVRWAEKIISHTLVPAVKLLPPRIQKSVVTDVDHLASRMLQEGRRSVVGLHVFEAKNI